MSESAPIKSVGARAGELGFFFVLVPALLFFMLFHMGEGGAYLVVPGQNIDTKLNLFVTAEDYLRQFPNGDISYQLKFAVDYLRDGSIAAWVLNLWPPGMPGLYWLILKLSGSNYFPIKIITLSTMFYALASYLVYRSLARGRFSPSFLVACALPLVFVTFQVSIFLSTNLFSSDFYCFALLAILLSLIFERSPQALGRLALMAVVLAALAYFRSFYFIFIKLLTVGSLYTLLVWGGWVMVRQGWRAAIKAVVQSKLLASFGVVLLLTWALLLPWKAYLLINERTFEWTATDQAWAAQWRNDLPLFLFGMNTPCILENDICVKLMPFQYPDTWATPKLGSDFYKRLSIVTFVSRPFEWYGEKAKVFHHFWFDGHEFDKNMSASQLIKYMQSAGLLVACVGLAIVSIIRLIRNISRHRPILEGNGLYVLFMAFFICNLVVFTFAHYESRYSVPLKWVTFLFFMFLLKDIMRKVDRRFFCDKAPERIQ
jgi:hypothetical protein